MAGSNKEFGTFDLQTRVYSQINTTTQTLSALAAYNGQLYATDFSDPSILYTVSDTGTLSPVGNTGTNITGLAFNASGILYANTGDELGTLIPSTGAYTNIGFTGFPSSNIFGTLAFSNGVLYDAIEDGGEGLLASLNLTTGAATVIGGSRLYGEMALFDAQNVLYGIRGTSLFSINTTSAALTVLGNITGSNRPGQFFAAVAAPTTSDVPEPATLGLFAIGGLALRLRGKRSR